jgi:hypothetical protein
LLSELPGGSTELYKTQWVKCLAILWCVGTTQEKAWALISMLSHKDDRIHFNSKHLAELLTNILEISLFWTYDNLDKSEEYKDSDEYKLKLL